ncbi:hypothetical protein CDAR_23661 [Caerostris darwini]|uniref:Uncharacterized protein n=1 Tax=Caerostris darwini TaxID=1538125 RepID=A0AAV4RSC7_9ARAC|nr:hypothetical protein CDAR_23661 [Caerostris darwini]
MSEYSNASGNSNLSEDDMLYQKRVDLGHNIVSFTLSCYQVILVCPWHEGESTPESFTEKHARKVSKLISGFGEYIWNLLESMQYYSITFRVAAIGKNLLKRYGYGPYTEIRYMAICVGFSILLVFAAQCQHYMLYWNIMRFLYHYMHNPPWYWRSSVSF